MKQAAKETSFSDALGGIKTLYSLYQENLKLLYLSTLVSVVISVSYELLDISVTDSAIMKCYSDFVVNKESVVMLKETEVMYESKTDDIKLKFYEEKHISVFLIADAVLNHPKQREKPLNRENIKETFNRLQNIEG